MPHEHIVLFGVVWNGVVQFSMVSYTMVWLVLHPGYGQGQTANMPHVRHVALMPYAPLVYS